MPAQLGRLSRMKRAGRHRPEYEKGYYFNTESATVFFIRSEGGGKMRPMRGGRVLVE